ncbi:S phase cyclin A-associated protein in the endoplasmic reticulum [Herpailurus yagouaroundi]|uniref:S phase cyclin A-associated protein in the endoplasmic reticulum n=1 Tax=Herpailurus yagouaroundi TaxID=1608482 RepID=UPI001AD60DA3|nr:S phase cyclin A-associated protein in the endoplasmic reticulum [Puma yagouaroundi]
MMLDNYVRDFKALIDWIQLQEKLEKTDAQSRPTSLAWEVKKMSPGRHVIPSPSTDRISVTSNARRSLNFGGSPGTVAAPRLAPTGVSWADKVKAHHTGSPASSDVSPAQSCPPITVQKTSRKNERKDAEGWETVQRGRPVRSRSTAVMTKVSVATETLRSKDDSDKENIQLLPDESIEKGEFDGDGPSNTIESRSKDSLHSCDHPLAERTQFTVNTLDDVKSSRSSTLQDHSLRTSEIPAVHIDTECVSIIQQADMPPLQANDIFSAEKAGIESEMDPSDISNVSAANLSMAEVLAKKEELADRLEKANEEAIASAIAEEEQLTREIEAEENNDINIETDNDSDFSASMGSGSVSFCGMSMDWNDVLADYEARETWRQNTSWGDIVEEEPARPPGHGIHMHEKLSSPSRKRTIAESKKKHEEKQMKAQQLREKLREEKTLKLQKLLEREKDVRKWKEELLDQRRRMMEEKLLHAEFKREVQLQAIVKKAQEEEAKVNEIAFINTLEAQNKRHDVLSKLKEYEQRLNELQEERQRRQEEKQARDEAVQERKRALEAERQARVEELLMKRKEQEARIEQQRQEKEKAREDAARERARDREERLAALTAAQQEAMEELQKKIQLKHDESIRRHMEQIEQRKEKAAELSSGRHANTDYAPKLTPYERKKQCSLCNVLISSEVYLFSHIKGKKHQQAVRENSSIQGRELSDEEVEHLSLKKYIIDIVVESAALPEPLKDGDERQKNKKKAKKIKARMNSRAKEYESLMETKNSGSDSPYKAKLQRLAKDLLKQLQVQDSGSWANNKVSALDRTLGEIARILEKKNVADQIAFQVAGGLTALEHILQVVVPTTNVNTASRIPLKSLCNAINVYNLTCSDCSENCTDVLFSNKITFLMDLLIHQLTARSGTYHQVIVISTGACWEGNIPLPFRDHPPQDGMCSRLRSEVPGFTAAGLTREARLLQATSVLHMTARLLGRFFSLCLLYEETAKCTPGRGSLSPTVDYTPVLTTKPGAGSPPSQVRHPGSRDPAAEKALHLKIGSFSGLKGIPPHHSLSLPVCNHAPMARQVVPESPWKRLPPGLSSSQSLSFNTALFKEGSKSLTEITDYSGLNLRKLLLEMLYPNLLFACLRGLSLCLLRFIFEGDDIASLCRLITHMFLPTSSYVVNIGLINKLHGCFLSVQGPVDENPKTATFLQHAAGLLHGMCMLCFAVTRRSNSVFDNNRQDPTGLTAALQATDLAGVLHMLYCVLFHGTISDPSTASPKESYTQNTVQVAIQSLQFFNSFAALDLPAFQSIVGAEGLSLAFRHIASSLLGHCSQVSCESLLHEVIVCVGYFTVNHPDNQVIVQSGRHPTVLQKLCQLPFQYFSDPRLIKVLFPSLIAACYNNRQNKIILEQEMSCVLLATFIQDFVQTSGQADNQLYQPKGKSLGSQDYLELANRFPQEAWEEARQFFLKKEKK